MASFDWILSLDPRWFSTLFAIYLFAGTFVQGIAATTLAVVLLRRRGFLPDPSSELQHHDLGKLLFAFSCF
jgi:peptidoglycan biosynthesis protein MviN/MurJ (putative lipid II flippase)